MPEESAEERAMRRKKLQFLCNSKDPEAIRCRLFVSGIVTQNARRSEMVDLFSPFGYVYDLTIHNGYIFVQYDNIQSSLTAIDKLDKSAYKGKVILVKLAEKGKKAEVAEKEVCRFFNQGYCMRGTSCNFKMDKTSKHVDLSKTLQRESRAVPNAPTAVRNGPINEPPRDNRPSREMSRPSALDNRSTRFPEKPRESPTMISHSREEQRFSDLGVDRDRRQPDSLSERTLKRPMVDEFNAGARKQRLSDPMGSYDFADKIRRSMDGGRSESGVRAPPPSQTSSAPKHLIPTPLPRPVEPPRSRPDVSLRSAVPQKMAEMVPSPRPGRHEAPPVDLRPPYDCVIIAGHEAQRSYCHLIDLKLAEFGMLTNVQIVGGEELLKRAVEEAARHTVPYTICVTANNEQHRSLTLNILHGVAQEHRNMPLDDAMPFLSRNFDKFVDMMKQKITAVNEWVKPEKNVVNLLNLLADGRRLVLDEVRQVDSYIQSVLRKLQDASTAASGGLSVKPKNAMGEVSSHGQHISRRDELESRGSHGGSLLSSADSSMDRGRHGLDLGMHDRNRAKEQRRESILPLAKEKDYVRHSTQQSQYASNEGRTGGLLGNGRGAPNSMLDFESPAVKQALNELLVPRNQRESSRHSYNMF